VSSYAKLALCALAAVALASAQTQKKYDQAEYNLLTEAAKSLSAGNFAKAITDLDAWKAKYPKSDLAPNRLAFYVQAYAGAKQHDQAVSAAGELLSGDIDAAVGDAGSVVRVLFGAVLSAQQIPAPTAAQLEVAQKAAKLLGSYEKKPDGVPDANWAQARAQMRTTSAAALIWVSLAPGLQAMSKKDCATAETIYTKALAEYPDSAQAAWSLGTAQRCLYPKQPEKASAALYAFARAAVVDPVKGVADPKWQKGTVEPYVRQFYNRYHGEDAEGLKQLLAAAAQSPTPPAGFHIKSMTEIAEEKERQFAQSNPQLALWMKVKGALAASEGEAYFASSLKDTAVPQLRGVLLEAKPACRPKELLVIVPMPDAPRPTEAEILLKLDKPIAGKPAPGTEFQWQGVPSAFTAQPFLLTMDTESAKLDGIKGAPCGVAPARKKR
jgi:tetratricopeptide (TPR) repeat protein